MRVSSSSHSYAPQIIRRRVPADPVHHLARDTAALREQLDALCAKLHDPSTASEADRVLWGRILRLAEHGGNELNLDFKGARQALQALPADVMELLGAICSENEPPVTSVFLPAKLTKVPPWLCAFGGLRTLSLPKYAGSTLRIRTPESLESLVLHEVSLGRFIKIRVPAGCAVRATAIDEKPVEVVPQRGAGCFRIVPRPVNMNGRVKFTRQGYPTHETIVCRHLALGMLAEYKQAQLRPLAGMEPVDPRAAFDSSEGIQGAVPPEFEKIYENVTMWPLESSLVSLGRWDEFLCALASRSDKRGEQAIFALVCTPNHSIAAVLAKDGPFEWKLHLSDPNGDRWVVDSRPFGFAQNLPSQAHFLAYFPDDFPGFAGCACVQFIVLRNPLAPQDCAAPVGKGSVSLDFLDPADVVHPKVAVRIALSGDAAAIDRLEAELMSRELSPLQWQGMMKGTDAHNTSLFLVTMEHGVTHAVESWGRLLVHAFETGKLGREAVIELLSVRSPLGVAPLVLAIHAGKSGPVKAYGRLLGRLHEAGALTPAEVRLLLMARGLTGIPSYTNIDDRNTGAAYIAAVRKLWGAGALTDEAAEELIQGAKDALALVD